MIPSIRPVLVAVTVLSLAGCAGFQDKLPSLPRFNFGKPAAQAVEPVAPAPRAAEVSKRTPGQWPQATSDVPADPATRFGALPNGMRYAITRNATPPGQASLRLRFDAGSLMETDAQQGLAHFLEHMAFNGSAGIPEGEMVKMLERRGLAFGADTNASTGFEETTYKLDLPQTDNETVDLSLKVLRETASELLIAADAVDRERGVVLSEERTRDGPGWRVYKSRLDFILRGQLPPKRYPIGKVDVLKTAPRADIADFYSRFYRPERAVLVVVGDFDVDVMEAKIKAAFGDWSNTAAAGVNPDLGPVAKRGLESRIAIEQGAPTTLQIGWVAAPDLRADSATRRRQDWIEQLGFAVLNRRLETIARSPEPPYIAAGAFAGNQMRAAKVTTIAVTARPGAWQPALTAAEQEQRRLVQYGVRQDELDREIEETRQWLKSRVAAAATRRTPQLANEMIDSVGDDDVITNPAQDLALFDDAAKNLKAETVSVAVRAAFAGSGPLVFLSTPTAVHGNEGAVTDAWKESRKVAVAEPEGPRQIAWPYQTFGPAGVVAEEREVVDLDTVFIRFENGVRLTIKPTRFRDDQVLVKVRTGGGLTDLPSDRQSLAWASSAIIEGGLAKISSEDMERVLASKVYGARFGVEDDALTLSGATRTDDLETQLQVLAGYASEPGWRPEALQRMRTYAATLSDQYEATDGGVLSRDLAGLLHGGDRRWTWPEKADIDAATADALKQTFEHSLTSGPLEVVIVGDVSVEKVIAAAATTFGALPRRPDPAPPTPADAAFPAPVATPVMLTHKGREDQAIALLAWRTDDFYSDVQRARNAAVMTDVMELRLIDELREKQGATYSPNVRWSASDVWTDWGYISAWVEVPPALVDGFYRDTLKIAADLRASPPTADEMERAKKPRLERLTKARETNEYWLEQLAGAQADPRRLATIRSLIAGYERVSAADVQQAAKTYLGADKAWRLIVKPAPE
ncbi:MAG: insulinase family protein [Caulobacter sp.]|nr:insulinase family protein [Caulobacter sp.]